MKKIESLLRSTPCGLPFRHWQGSPLSSFCKVMILGVPRPSQVVYLHPLEAPRQPHLHRFHPSEHFVQPQGGFPKGASFKIRIVFSASVASLYYQFTQPCFHISLRNNLCAQTSQPWVCLETQWIPCAPREDLFNRDTSSSCCKSV